MTGCSSKSLLGKTRPFSADELRAKVANLVRGVDAVAARATAAAGLWQAGLPSQALDAMYGEALEKNSYTGKFLPTLLHARATPGCPAPGEAREMGNNGGVIRALSWLTGIPEARTPAVVPSLSSSSVGGFAPVPHPVASSAHASWALSLLPFFSAAALSPSFGGRPLLSPPKKQCLNPEAEVTPAVCTVLVALLARELRKTWRVGPRVPQPTWVVADVSPLLCAWQSGGFRGGMLNNNRKLYGHFNIRKLYRHLCKKQHFDSEASATKSSCTTT